MGFLLPSPAFERQWVDCGELSVLLKTTDPRLTRFRYLQRHAVQVYLERRIELDAYLAIIADLNQCYGGTIL